MAHAISSVLRCSKNKCCLTLGAAGCGSALLGCSSPWRVCQSCSAAADAASEASESPGTKLRGIGCFCTAGGTGESWGCHWDFQGLGHPRREAPRGAKLAGIWPGPKQAAVAVSHKVFCNTSGTGQQIHAGCGCQGWMHGSAGLSARGCQAGCAPLAGDREVRVSRFGCTS